MNEKPQKCTYILHISCPPWEDLLSLTPRLKLLAIIEVATLQVLSLKASPWWLYRAEYLPSTNWTYIDTGFTVAKLAILTWRNLNVTAICVYKTAGVGLAKCLWVCCMERETAILEGYHHTVVWQRYCRKVTFWACRQGRQEDCGGPGQIQRVGPIL